MSMKTRWLLQRNGRSQYDDPSDDRPEPAKKPVHPVEIVIRNKTRITREIARSIRRALKSGRDVSVIDGGGNTGIGFPINPKDFL